MYININNVDTVVTQDIEREAELAIDRLTDRYLSGVINKYTWCSRQATSFTKSFTNGKRPCFVSCKATLRAQLN